MSAVPKSKLTVAEYLAIERRAEFKSEFYRGEMFAMAGASREHNAAKDNLVGGLYAPLKAGPCRTFSSDQRVKVSRTGLYAYPDIIIVCGQAEYDPDDPDTLLNPQVLFEILSESTEKYDRGKKFAQYQQIPSLREYVLVCQDRMRVERFVRQPDDKWLLTIFTAPNAEFALATVSAAMTLRDVYAGVEFAETEADLK